MAHSFPGEYLLSPCSPRFPWSKQHPDAIAFFRATDIKVNGPIDTNRSNRRVRQQITEDSHADVANQDQRRGFPRDGEPLALNSQMKLAPDREIGYLWVNYSDFRTLGGHIRD